MEEVYGEVFKKIKELVSNALAYFSTKRYMYQFVF
jgi:hypothetical protein